MSTRKKRGVSNLKKEDQTEIKSEPSENHCRVCLKSGNVPIYGSNVTEDLSENLQYFAGIEIEESDNLSKHICSSCYCILKSFERFRNTAQENDRVMKANQLAEESFDEDYDGDNDFNDKPFSKEEYNEAYNDDFFGEDAMKYYCTRCSLDFNNREEYSAHIKTEEHRKFKVECPICKGLYTTIYIKKHIAWHRLSTEQSFICDVCGKSFPVIHALNRHRATHGFDLPFKCDLCPYKGRFSDSLKIHMRTHTGEKPYKCELCSAKFINKSNLNKHSHTHKSEPNYKCEGCGRGFNAKSELELHFKVFHSGIKEHVCDICGKAFGYRKQMMKHQLRVHKRQKFRSGRVPLYIQAEQLKEKRNRQEQEQEQVNLDAMLGIA